MAKGRTPKNRLQGAELKAFRHKVSQLKALGGVSKRTDARKQKPTRYMVGKVKRLEPVLKGEAALVPRKKIRPDILADYERTHSRVGRNVVIPKTTTEKLHVRRGMPELHRTIADTGERRVVSKRVPIPVDIGGIDDFIDDLRNRPDFWASRRGPYPPWVFGFTVNGGRSIQLFENPESLADFLEQYPSEFLEAAWDTFVLYAVDIERHGVWHTPKSKKRGPRKARRPTGGFRLADLQRRDRERKARIRAAQSDADRERERERNAAQHRNRRARLKEASVRRLPKR